MQEDVERLLENDEFTVWAPACVEVIEKAGVDLELTRPIGGWCSTQNIDRQDEVVVAQGLDFSEFVAFGYFNDNHKQETGAVLGYPRIARLEKSRWWTEGNLLVGYPPADKVWELAKALKKSRAPRNLGFSIEGKVLERNGSNRIVRAKVRNVAITNAPVNTDCFPGDVRVSGTAEKVFRRWYSGPMVEVVLATGEKLSGTPNHPILTQRGWVGLGQLDERSDRVGCLAGDADAFQAPHHVDHMPPTLDEVFHLASIILANKRIHPAGEEQFHGDGSARNSNVDVVLVDGELRDRFIAQFEELFGKRTFSASQLGQRVLPDARFVDQFGRRSFASTSSSVSGARELAALLGCEAFEAQGTLGTTAADTRSLSSDDATDGVSIDAKAGTYRDRALASSVRFSNVTSKRVYDFSGHVHNLQTTHSWYAANGIVAHNCSWSIMSKAFAPMPVVERAARKALAENSALVQSVGVSRRGHHVDSIILQRNDVLSFREAVDRVSRIHPHFSKSTCERVVRFALSR